MKLAKPYAGILVTGILVTALSFGGPAHAASTFEVIARFARAPGGTQPEAGAIVDPADGRSLFATADSGGAANGGTLVKLTPPATPDGRWSRRVIYDFPGTAGGTYPLGLVPDGAGGLFGYTLDGGSAAYGTIYQASPRPNPANKWTAKQLHSFMFGADGAYPSGLILRGKTLIGTTVRGGGGGSCRDSDGALIYCGAVVQLTPPASPGGLWTEKVIYAFTGGDDGRSPTGHLLLRGGKILGTTTGGGSGGCFYSGVRLGCGVVYQLSPPNTPGGSWTQQVLFSFPGGADGSVPVDGVISEGGGSLFGVTAGGGNQGTGSFGLGTVYQLRNTAAGWSHTVLYRFSGGADGELPQGGLLYDAAKRTLYGTTQLGGTTSFAGTVFQLEKPPAGRWSKSVLHNFNGQDGANPSSALVADSTGALYGTTVRGDPGGTLYRISFTP